MRLTAVVLLAVLVLAGLWLWWSGTLAVLAWQAAQHQHEAQTTLARAITRVRGGEGLAWLAVLGACFAYGVLHAAGPGHGKAVIGSAALASRAGALRLSGLALVSSLGQAITAIVLVYGGFLLFEFTARQATGAADRLLEPLSYLIIAAVGAYLVFRGLRALWRRQSGQAHADHSARQDHAHHDHDHHHDETCGHAHVPTLEQVDAIQSWRAALVLVAGIAIRPCTGAIFVLAICWQAGLVALGIASALAMAAGTAVFTVLVALAAVYARDTSLYAMGQTRFLGWTMPVLQVLAGAGVLALAVVMLMAGRLGG